MLPIAGNQGETRVRFDRVNPAPFSIDIDTSEKLVVPQLFAADNVVVNATTGDDVAVVAGAGPNARVIGLSALVSVSGAIAGSDRLTVKALAGDDVVDASGLAADSALLTLDGGDGDDIVIDPFGVTTVTSATKAGKQWLATHVHVVNGKTVLDVGGKQRTLPRADLSQLTQAVTLH
jgi:hypothetical protein